MRAHIFIAKSALAPDEIPPNSLFFLYETNAEKITALYYGKRLLTPGFRRGLALKDRELLSKLRRSEPGELLPIRKKDFIRILRDFKKRQISSAESSFLRLNEKDVEYIRISSSGSHLKKFSLWNANKRFQDFFKRWVLAKESASRNEVNSVRELNDLRLEFSRVYPELKNKVDHQNDLVLIADEVIRGACFQDLFFAEDAKPRILVPGIDSIRLRSKIRRVLLISNLNGSALEHSVCPFFVEAPPSHMKVTIRRRAFSREELVLAIRDVNRWDLIIYEGHSEVQNGRICWRIENNERFVLPDGIHRYVHLSCLPPGDSIDQLPFSQGILSASTLQDRDYLPLVTALWNDIENGVSFPKAAQRAIASSEHSRDFFLFG